MKIYEVPSPIDLRNAPDAIQWSNEANIKRPWRYDIYKCYVELIQSRGYLTVLELGSGPGFLAQYLLEYLPEIHYSAFDFSEPMHELSKAKLSQIQLERTRYILGDFKQNNWTEHLGCYDVVIIHQALHELRHKGYATTFHHTVRSLLKPKGIYLLCDHLCAEGDMSNDQLYMTEAEHISSLEQAEFRDIHKMMLIHGLIVFQCH